MISAAVVGASGYAGGELLRLLAGHQEVKLAGAYDIINVDRPAGQIHPNLRGAVDLKIEKPDYGRMGKAHDVVFSATPHGIAMGFVPELLDGGAKVVDLSADYRFDDLKVFEKYYKKHENPQLESVYGLPEIYRKQIKRAKLVANPGCYPTATILGLAPLVKERLIDLEHIVIDAKSGTSGAGTKPSETLHHPACAENLKAYLATSHRHEPEISQELSKLAGKKVRAHFTPHLIPIVRGILTTMHVFARKRTSEDSLLELYRRFYRGERFVRVFEELPQVNSVVGSNFCDVGVEPAQEGKRLVIASAIDNLIKGASGQAVQNMNLMFGIDEGEGLETLVPHP
jgi:N-acetyl-gamma-glutamyl-phosphate reductase